MRLNKADYKNISEVILNEERWALVGHSIPDGDCIGAITAMALALQKMGKEVTAFVEDGVPDMYRFLNGSDVIRAGGSGTEEFDSVIYLDCAGPERAGDRIKDLFSEAKIVLNIDHHISNTGFGTVDLVDSRASSTCEIVYHLMKTMGIEVDQVIGTPLYCGMVMDTGSFQYTATKPETLRIAAELLECGVDLDEVRSRLYESKSRLEIAVLEKALSSLTFSRDGRISWMILSYADMAKIGAVGQHFEGTINIARSVAGVEVAVLFREIEPGSIKIGLRSRGTVDVNRVAGTWGGGGHRLAAGALLMGSMESVTERVVTRIMEELT